jgi:hypothetical protein
MEHEAFQLMDALGPARRLRTSRRRCRRPRRTPPARASASVD